ncbi:MAG: hypothetical protein MUP47_07410 [Phycisphaerae bacterium]|nr:hypothetical protein [Phycisphaerae bacterium]
MTKRELIDHILNENQTAEPAFLAQFSDEQLREYLTHLEWLKQPPVQGDASRFDRYFRSGPSAASPSGRWRSTDDIRGGSWGQSLNVSAQPAAPAVAAPEAAPAPAPDGPAAMGATLLPAIQEFDFDAPLPTDAETLEALQLSPQERTELARPSEDASDADEPPAAQDREPSPDLQAAQSPSAETPTEEPTWLF